MPSLPRGDLGLEPIGILKSLLPLEERERCDCFKFVLLVDVMLDLNRKIQAAKSSEKERVQRQIEETDREIDDIVYKLYGITKKERIIIEGEV